MCVPLALQVNCSVNLEQGLPPLKLTVDLIFIVSLLLSWESWGGMNTGPCSMPVPVFRMRSTRVPSTRPAFLSPKLGAHCFLPALRMLGQYPKSLLVFYPGDLEFLCCVAPCLFHMWCQQTLISLVSAPLIQLIHKGLGERGPLFFFFCYTNVHYPLLP